jgi:starvation-inducible DNA-binding protein
VLRADDFVFYLKTKNCHRHLSGLHFRDYRLLRDEHADRIFAMIDLLVEQARKIGGISRQQCIAA